jgi:hypothetical protein
VRRERGHLIGAPYLQWHRSQGLLEPVGVVGGKQAESAPFARLLRRPAEPAAQHDLKAVRILDLGHVRAQRVDLASGT